MHVYHHRRSGRPIAESRVVAHHEAGHAVVSIALGLPVDGAALLDGTEGDADGIMMHGRQLDWLEAWVALHRDAREVGARVVMPMRLTPRQRRQVERYIMVCWGGIVAESILLGGRASQRWRGATYSDRLDAEIAARLLVDARGARAYVAARRAEARRILIARWSDVEKISRALRRRERVVRWRELTGRELRALIHAKQSR